MMCKVTKDDASKLNILSDQVFNLLGMQGTGPAMKLMAMTGASLCLQSNALIHGMGNQLMIALLAHRQTHGEFTDITHLGDLKKRPEVLLALVEDFNELFGAILRGVDPANDYMFNLFKTEKSPTQENKG